MSPVCVLTFIMKFKTVKFLSPLLILQATPALSSVISFYIFLIYISWNDSSEILKLWVVFWIPNSSDTPPQFWALRSERGWKEREKGGSRGCWFYCVYESRAFERHCVRGKLLYLKVFFGAPKKHHDGWPLGSTKTSLMMNSSPSLLWAHMWRNTYVRTKAPFVLLISQPSCMMRSIKGLFGFYSTQAVMRHLWEANFKSHLGSLLCCRCYATPFAKAV